MKGVDFFPTCLTCSGGQLPMQATIDRKRRGGPGEKKASDCARTEPRFAPLENTTHRVDCIQPTVRQAQERETKRRCSPAHGDAAAGAAEQRDQPPSYDASAEKGKEREREREVCRRARNKDG